MNAFRWANIEKAGSPVNEKLNPAGAQAKKTGNARYGSDEEALPQAEIDPAVFRLLLLLRCKGFRLHNEDAVRSDRAVFQEQ